MSITIGYDDGISDFEKKLVPNIARVFLILVKQSPKDGNVHSDCILSRSVHRRTSIISLSMRIAADTGILHLYHRVFT